MVFLIYRLTVLPSMSTGVLTLKVWVLGRLLLAHGGVAGGGEDALAVVDGGLALLQGGAPSSEAREAHSLATTTPCTLITPYLSARMVRWSL